jgi:hypothetical protein
LRKDWSALRNFPLFSLSTRERLNNNCLNSLLYNQKSNQLLRENTYKTLGDNKISNFSQQLEQNEELNEEKNEETCDLLKLDKSSNYLLKYFFASIIQFARSIPFYNLVSQEDQILLLQNCWHELFILCLTQSKFLIEHIKDLSMSSLCETEAFSLKNLAIPRSNNDESNLKKEICPDALKTHLENLDMLKFQIEKIRSFNLTNEEFSYLKAILLFNSGDFFNFRF